MHVESLEDRRLLAVFSVTNLNDFGAGSLRQAMLDANSTSGTDDITFTSGVVGTINIDSQLPTITAGLNIIGPGQELLTIDAGNGLDGEFATGDGWRIFEINDNTPFLIDVSISGLKLTGGDTSRGMDDSLFSRGVPGGAIASLENFELLHSTVTGNATGDGGDSSSPFGIGGDGGLGGGILAAYGEIRIVSSTITNNQTGTGGMANTLGRGGRGGGIATLGGQVSIEESIVTGNRTTGNSAYGGGISSDSGEVIVLRSTVSGNLTDGNFSSGGGIANRFGNILIDSSAIYGNLTQGDNSGGGGFYNRRGAEDDVAEIRDTTISGNSIVDDEGGGVLNLGGIMNIVRSTITSNTAPVDKGSGLFSLSNSVATVNFYNSIVAGNSNEDLASSSLSHPFASLGYNLIGTSATPEFIYLENFDQPGDVTGVTNPLLGPLADNGGPTQTHALLPGSPALDTGDPDVLFDPAEFDQRAAPFQRVAQGTLSGVPSQRIDIGAYEAQGPPLADFDANWVINGNDFLIWQRGFRTTGATQLEGDSDQDGDVDASDLAAWFVGYGDTIILPPISAAMGDTDSEPSATKRVSNATIIDAALARELLSAGGEEEVAELLPANLLAVVEGSVVSHEQTAPVNRVDSFSNVEPGGESADLPWLADELLERLFE